MSNNILKRSVAIFGHYRIGCLIRVVSFYIILMVIMMMIQGAMSDLPS